MEPFITSSPVMNKVAIDSVWDRFGERPTVHFNQPKNDEIVASVQQGGLLSYSQIDTVPEGWAPIRPEISLHVPQEKLSAVRRRLSFDDDTKEESNEVSPSQSNEWDSDDDDTLPENLPQHWAPRRPANPRSNRTNYLQQVPRLNLSRHLDGDSDSDDGEMITFNRRSSLQVKRPRY